MNNEIVISAQQAKDELMNLIEQVAKEYNDKYFPLRIQSLELYTVETSIRGIQTMVRYERKINVQL